MKLLSLNLAGGELFEPLMEFLRSQAPTTDIFCFQEVFSSEARKTDGAARTNLLQELTATLPDFEPRYVPTQHGLNYVTLQRVPYPLSAGMAVFTRRSMRVTASSAPFILGSRNSIEGLDLTTFPKVLQRISFQHNGSPFTVFHIHGPWTSGWKGDTEKTLAFFQRVSEALARSRGKKILCGDFNLAPDTKSLLLVEAGMHNLITEFSVKTTRSPVYKKAVSPFADYILVSPGVKVKEFSVPEVAVSDHLPLILEFE